MPYHLAKSPYLSYMSIICRFPSFMTDPFCRKAPHQTYRNFNKTIVSRQVIFLNKTASAAYGVPKTNVTYIVA